MAIITIGGDVGAGKTTLATKLAAALGYKEFYMGRVFRDMAAERNQTIDEFYISLKDNPELERQADERQIKFMKTNDNIVTQGRISYHFAKMHSLPAINVFIAVAPHVGALRQSERPEYTGKSIEEITRISAARVAAEREHYKELYGIEDHLDKSRFDIVLDTTNLTENQALEKLLVEIKPRLS